MFSGSAWSLSSSDTLQQSMLTTPSTNERRPLKSIDYSGPNFKLHSKFLAKDYVEKEARVSFYHSGFQPNLKVFTVLRKLMAVTALK